MDYHLSLTPRLVFLGGSGLLLLMALLFLLGVHAGRDLPHEGRDSAEAAGPAPAASMARRSASQAEGKARKSAPVDLAKGKS